VTIPLLDVDHQEIVTVKLFVQSYVQTVWYLLAKHDRATNDDRREYHTHVHFFVKLTIPYLYCFMVFQMLAIFLYVVLKIQLLDVNHQGIVAVKLMM